VKRLLVLLALLLAPLLVPLPATAGPAPDMRETPALAPLVASGELPPVAQRIPEHPRVIDLPAMGRDIGKFGGDLRMVMADQRDIRMITIYSYARLVVFDEHSELQPDILESFDVEEGRKFTLHLRPGHKWSDGKPFTAEDFRYWWEDVANNKRLSPGGPPMSMMAHGEPPTFEVIDPLTVRYTWKYPNPVFLPALAGPQPLYIFMPAHYLRQFHQRYADKDALATATRAARVRDWGALHERMSRQYRPENPSLPTLEPWQNTTAPPSELFVFKRNPFYHRIDTQGRQLPYIDSIRMSLASASLIPAKVGSGESDLQARYLRFDNYTFLKEAEQRNNYQVRLWERAEGAWFALLPNMNAADPVWRELMCDVRVRRALSLGINRRDINQVIFFGLAKESANTVLPQSSLFEPRLAAAYARYDVTDANRLLDEAGLSRRDSDGIRLLPDGRRMEFNVETAGEGTEQSDVLELVADDWLKIGVKIFPRSTQSDVFRRRIFSGQTVMSVWQGLDNGIPGPDVEPDEIAPSNSLQYQWPRWGQYVESMGRNGEPIDDPEVAKLAELHRDWRRSTTREERRQIWEKMLAIQADQVFTIGVVNQTAQPVVVSNRLRNVPVRGLFSFEPGAFFGVYMPDTFWFVDADGG